MMTIQIDEEFATLIPPLSADERAQLEQNLVAEGRARDPLMTWQGVLLDGHNRYEICTRLGLPFDTREVKNVTTRDEAKVRIVRNQLGRRNLPAAARIELALAVEPIIAAKAKERQGARTDIVSNLTPSEGGKTRDAVAGIAAVSAGTLHAYKKARETATPELVDAMRSGEVSISAAAEIATLPAAQQVKALESGEAVAVAKKIRAKKATDDGKEEPESTTRRKSAQEQKHDEAVAEAEDLRDRLSEQAAQFEEVLAENIAMSKIVEADDKLAEAAAQIRQLTAENLKLRERIVGLTNEAAEAKKLAKFWKNKAERAEKAGA